MTRRTTHRQEATSAAVAAVAEAPRDGFVPTGSLPLQYATFDPKADYVWRRTNQFTDDELVLAGDPVTERHKEVLGARLWRFWQSGYVQLAHR